VTGDRFALFIGASPTDTGGLLRLDLNSMEVTTLRQHSPLTLDPGYLSVAEPVEFPTADGLTAHGLFYAPRNQDFVGPYFERPPLLVLSHGGPTSATTNALRLHIQFWTSRGFAVLDVDYGGSTGYGREYRDRLKGTWGVVDVQDCVNGARYLAQQGRVDPEKLAIRGGSAGGYTTLCALTFYDLFQAGASHFGISDLKTLVRDTHKFESRYPDSLLGPYPEAAELYDARSPLQHAEQLNTPVIFLQGGQDRVVPPNQAELLVEVLKRKGVPHEYVLYPDEGHGFRQAATIKDSLSRELAFYRRVLEL
jgi:dipeptidyl aminopeptidase/acylaminoacyl peptidase